MSYQYHANNQCCATCNYWAGPRQVDTFNSKSIVDRDTSSGRCVAPAGVGYRGSDKNANHSCNGWSLWGAIR
jgi:hypothetical protein